MLFLLDISGSKWIFTWKRLFRLESDLEQMATCGLHCCGRWSMLPPSSSDWSVPWKYVGWVQRCYTMQKLGWLMIDQSPWRDQWLIFVVFIDDKNIANSVGKDYCKGVGNLETETNATCPEASFLQQKEDIHHRITITERERPQNKGKEKTSFLTGCKAMPTGTMEATLFPEKKGPRINERLIEGQWVINDTGDHDS